MVGLSSAERLGIKALDEAGRVELRPHWTQDDVTAVIRAAYIQVFGNEYLMSVERVTSAESLLLQGQISVKDFVRAIAQSETYRQKFFYPNSQTRLIELNYKHLLGRAPYDESEIAFHVDLYNAEGYEAEISSYIDSVEYQENFGDSVVPYYRGFATQRNQKTVGFNRMFQLYRGYANSDRAQNQKQGRLTREVARNTASPISTPSTGKALAGNNGGGQLYRITAMQGSAKFSPQVRRTTTEYLVPYDQLSSRLQQINKRGGKVVNITTA
ncbi:phycobilisome linker polypeptide [Microcoleus sp. bin38.metabat.b11b12b14.051]|uniref:phycobilisome linker polypeptide n=1 Tax=Microcoleus sp. bin38.metabat.b11b12b14.051 TaxID=2742709 RepID=UPI0025D73EAC|nr:phycobilisome linker polypeptide [Microcoleus sp. bin38.metabat.b11b12b14.051]